jgi:hypothetical protein
MSYSRASRCLLLSTRFLVSYPGVSESLIHVRVQWCELFTFTFTQCCFISQSNRQCIIRKHYSVFSCAKHYLSAVRYPTHYARALRWTYPRSLRCIFNLTFRIFSMQFICYGQENALCTWQTMFH